MSHSTGISTNPNVFAVAHRVGNDIYALAIDSGARGAQPAVIGTRQFTAEQLGRIESWLDEHKVSRVIGVLPASAIISRTCTLPDVDDAHLDQALHLQAEAHLLGIAPPHRQGMAVIDHAAGETARSGLVIAWRHPSAAPDLPIDRPMTWAADVVAMAAIINGHRPTEPLVWVDHTNHSVAIALAHANGVAFRATRDDAEDDADTSEVVTRILVETALNVSHTGTFIETIVDHTRTHLSGRDNQPASFLVPGELIEHAAHRLAGVKTDGQWWNTFGIAAGVAIAALNDLAPLTEMIDHKPEVRASALERLTAACSSWSRASLFVLLAIVLLMFGPLLVHGARYGILSARYPDIDLQRRDAEHVQKKQSMYEYLEDNGWSVTKVLSDVACCTPRGIDVSTVRVNAQDRSFAVAGSALPHEGLNGAEIANLMQKNLISTRIFKDISLSGRDPDYQGKYEFDLTAKVDRPYLHAKYEPELDFGVYTLLDRMLGKTAEEAVAEKTGSGETRLASAVSDAPSPSPTAARAVIGDPDDDPDDQPATDDQSDMPDNSSRAADTRDAGGHRFGNSGGGDGTFDPGSTRDIASATTSGPGMTIPEALSEAQIGVMTEPEVRDQLHRVAEAQKHHSVSEEVRARLMKEFNMLVARLHEIKGSNRKDDT